METAGELNYMITKLVLEYQKLHGLSYQTINDIQGALVGARDEYYRKVVVNFEDGKCSLNGEVYL